MRQVELNPRIGRIHCRSTRDARIRAERGIPIVHIRPPMREIPTLTIARGSCTAHVAEDERRARWEIQSFVIEQSIVFEIVAIAEFHRRTVRNSELHHYGAT